MQTQFSSLIDKYDGFIFDLYGVIYDGVNFFNEALDLINKLESLNKKIFYLSNSPRPYFTTVPKLRKNGINVSKNNILTSGDLVRRDLKNNLNDIFKLGFGNFYQVGAECNSDLLVNIEHTSVDSVNQADYLMLTPFIDDIAEQDKYDHELKLAIERGLPAVCTNPDKIVIDNKNIRYPAGFFANRYEQMGGDAYYYGKPNPLSFKFAYDSYFDKFDIPKNKILMIGDSIDTDILGANRFGIDSVLVLTGCAGHKIREDSSYRRFKKDEEPTYIFDSLK